MDRIVEAIAQLGELKVTVIFLRIITLMKYSEVTKAITTAHFRVHASPNTCFWG